MRSAVTLITCKDNKTLSFELEDGRTLDLHPSCVGSISVWKTGVALDSSLNATQPAVETVDTGIVEANAFYPQTDQKKLASLEERYNNLAKINNELKNKISTLERAKEAAEKASHELRESLVFQYGNKVTDLERNYRTRLKDVKDKYEADLATKEDFKKKYYDLLTKVRIHNQSMSDLAKDQNDQISESCSPEHVQGASPIYR